MPAVVEVASFDLLKHLIDISDGEGVLNRGSDHCEFLLGIATRLTPPRLSQGLPDPLGRRQVVSPCDALDLVELLFLENDLKSLTHTMSMIDSVL